MCNYADLDIISAHTVYHTCHNLYTRSLPEITGDYWRILETTGEYQPLMVLGILNIVYIIHDVSPSQGRWLNTRDHWRILEIAVEYWK